MWGVCAACTSSGQGGAGLGDVQPGAGLASGREGVAEGPAGDNS